MEADEAVRRQHKANAAAMAGLSLDSRVGNRLAPRGGGAGTDHKLGKSLPRKSHENADEGEEWEEAVNDDDDYDEEVEETKQVEAASRIFYKSKSVAELLGVPVKPKAASSSTSSSSSSSSSDSSSSSSSSAGNVTLSTLSQSSQDSIDTLKVPTATDHAHEERLNELVKRRQEMVRLEAKLKGLEEALTTERTELRRLESQLPPAASRFTTLIATKSSTALLQLRDEQLAAKAAKEQRKKARAEKKKAKEAKRKASAGGSSDSFIAATDTTTTDTSGDDTKVGALLVGDLLRSGGR